MKTKEEAKLNMYNAILSFCGQNDVVITPIPALKTSIDVFKNVVTSITNTLPEFNNQTEQYTDHVQSSCNTINARFNHSSLLIELYKEADRILKDQMDKIVPSILLSNPEFHNSYGSNRIIVGSGTTPSHIKGTITNNNTNEPIRNALVTILERETVVSTGGRGRYMIKPLVPGIYTLRITKEGFQPKVITDVHVKLGQITIIDAALLPAILE